MPYPTSRRALPVVFFLTAAFVAVSCSDPAGAPETLEAGSISFHYAGPWGSSSFAADGRCYWAPGYPAADSTCALAMNLGDTLLIRGTVEPRTIRWQQVNLRFPRTGVCAAADDCEIALDYINRAGTVQQQLRSLEADVTVAEDGGDRVRGTFTGLLYRVGGEASDTLRISEGTFNVPVDP